MEARSIVTFVSGRNPVAKVGVIYEVVPEMHQPSPSAMHFRGDLGGFRSYQSYVVLACYRDKKGHLNFRAYRPIRNKIRVLPFDIRDLELMGKVSEGESFVKLAREAYLHFERAQFDPERLRSPLGVPA